MKVQQGIVKEHPVIIISPTTVEERADITSLLPKGNSFFVGFNPEFGQEFPPRNGTIAILQNPYFSKVVESLFTTRYSKKVVEQASNYENAEPLSFIYTMVKNQVCPARIKALDLWQDLVWQMAAACIALEDFESSGLKAVIDVNPDLEISCENIIAPIKVALSQILFPGDIAFYKSMGTMQPAATEDILRRFMCATTKEVTARLSKITGEDQPLSEVLDLLINVFVRLASTAAEVTDYDKVIFYVPKKTWK